MVVWLWGVKETISWRAKEKIQAVSILRRLFGVLSDLEGYGLMSKMELIEYICKINRSAKPEFLETFTEEELNEYLEHLMELDLEELAVCT